jgi:hypothetical protein
MTNLEKSEWLAYRTARELATRSSHDSVEDVKAPSLDSETYYPLGDIAMAHDKGMGAIVSELEALAELRGTIKRNNGKANSVAVQARRKLRNADDDSPNMRYDVTDTPNYTSPEGVLWTREAEIDKALQLLLDSAKTLSDHEKMQAYNVLVLLPNKAPLYYRDSVFAIAWEKHYNNLGKRGIVRELASTLWMIRHLGLYGFSRRYAIERLQGVLKTNKLESMFHSSTVDDMINNYEREAVYYEEHTAQESDYYESFGVSANPTQANETKVMALSLEDQLRYEVHGYLDGLSKVVKARIERYVDRGMCAFIRNDTDPSLVNGVKIFTTRLFHGYVKHVGLTMADFDGIMAKRMFLTYVYTYYRRLDAYGVAAHYTDSIDLAHGKLTHTLANVEYASRGKGEAIRRTSAGKPSVPVIKRKTIVNNRVTKVKRPLLRNYNYDAVDTMEAAEAEAGYSVRWGDRRNW